MKLVIGTAQFGLKYGIANNFKIVKINDIKKILNSALDKGVNYLDTAKSYGKAEEILGSIGIKKWKIINKISKFDKRYKSPNDWLKNNLIDSFNKLKIDNFDTLLFHNSSDLLQNYGQDLFNQAVKFKNKGYFKKIGISIYSTNELEKIQRLYDFDSYQLPCNIFDKRFINNGSISRLHNNKKEIQIRSIFLQGMILKNQYQLPKKFNKWQVVWNRYDKWLQKNQIKTLEACISFIKNQRNIDKILIGFNNESQFNLFFNQFRLKHKCYNFINFTNDENLLNPSKW